MAKKQFWGFVQRFREKAEIDGENDGERGELRVESGEWRVESGEWRSRDLGSAAKENFQCLSSRSAKMLRLRTPCSAQHDKLE